MTQYQEFIKSHIGDLAHQNYKYVEILLGNEFSKKNITSNITRNEITIFDTKLNEKIYHKILNFFKEKLRNLDPNVINNKIYLYNNLQLSINDSYQSRCFKKNNIDFETTRRNNLQLLLNFSEKKMIPINRFDNKFQYESEFLKTTISYNIKKKFFLNFSKITDLSEDYYNISFLITKKNGKSNEVIKLLEMYLSVIEELI